MADTLNGDLLRIARQYRGFNQKELAERLGVEPSTISRAENGIVHPNEALVEKAAALLRLPKAFFYQADRIYGLPVSVHPMWRKKTAVTQRDSDQFLAGINIRILHLRRLLRALDFEPKLPLPRFEMADYEGNIEQIAADVRRMWLLPSGPIRELTATVETAGIFVFHIDLEHTDIDGVTIGAPDLPPCVFLNKNLPGDRMRFTLAHELAHIVLHRYPSEHMEAEANHFAGALLLPKNDIHNEFVGQKIDLRFLARMKPVWRTSMQNILYRARKLGYVTDAQSQYLWRQFNYHKMRLREPPELDIPVEKTTLVPMLIDLHMRKLGYTAADMQTMLCMEMGDLNDLYGIKPAGPLLRVVT
jgi:Zn-dependent peptidase ImmA (M78 family)/transcriptional regulator with XRE-family HTH domain